jgi:hypothetical protein
MFIALSACTGYADIFCLRLAALVLYDAAIQAHKFSPTITRHDIWGVGSESGGTSTDATFCSVSTCERCVKPGAAPLLADAAVGAHPYAHFSSG